MITKEQLRQIRDFLEQIAERLTQKVLEERKYTIEQVKQGQDLVDVHNVKENFVVSLLEPWRKLEWSHFTAWVAFVQYEGNKTDLSTMAVEYGFVSAEYLSTLLRGAKHVFSELKEGSFARDFYLESLKGFES